MAFMILLGCNHSISKQLLLIAFYLLSIGSVIAQDIASSERMLNSNNISQEKRIELLNNLSRDLTFANPIKALQYANEAYSLSESTNNSMGLAYAYRNLANIYFIHEESYFISMEYLQRAISIFSTEKDSVGIANCYISFGHIYRQLQNRKEEIEYHQKSLDIFEKLNIRERIGVTAHNLGESHFNIGDLEKSRELTLYAIGINDSIKNESVLSSCLKVMGKVEMAAENYSLAKEYFYRVLEISDRLDENSQKVATVESLLGLANLYRLTNNKEKEIEFLIRAATFSKKYKQIKYLQSSANSLEDLVLNAPNVSQRDSLQKYIQLYNDFSDSLAKVNRQEYRNSLAQSLIKVHELSREKSNLEKSNISQSHKIRNRNIILILSTVFFLILIFLLVNLLKFNARLKKQKQIIEGQKQDLELNATNLLQQNEEITRQRDQLNDALSKLKELDTFKEGMTNMIVHDMKNPLNTIIGLTEKPIVKQAANQMLNMVANILDVNKFENAEMKIDRHNHALVKVVDEAITQVHFLVEKKSLNLHNRIKNNTSVLVDYTIVVRVFVNMFTNAIKFTSNNGSILIKAEEEANFIKVFLSDTGKGIPDDMWEKVFDKFIQVEARKLGSVRSTGLGLTFCKMAVEAHGGEIGLSSELQNGTTFWFTLPKGEKLKHTYEPDRSTPKKWQLTDRDKEKLNIFFPMLEQYSVYEYGDLEKVLTSIEPESSGITIWKNKLETAILACNEEQYNKLLQMVKPT